jgi:[ribosomal protein S5]-alanine N-acetyltransferase
MADPLQTDRLLLSPLKLADADQIQKLFPQWEIVKYLNASVPWPYPANGAFCYLNEVAIPAMQRGNEWHWTLRLKTSAEQIIGAIGLNKGETMNRGFWIAPLWQNQGLMTEAVFATNNYWFDALGFRVLRAPKAICNGSSRRISQKTGMRVVAVEDHTYVSGKLPTEIWEITDQEWRSKRDSLLLEKRERKA